MSNTNSHFDVLIIGSGAAGMAIALSLASQYRIALLSKSSLVAGSSPHAQGGIAAVLKQGEDSYQAHINDTLKAGAGLCHKAVVRHTIEQGKAAIHFLMEKGVQFSQDPEHPGQPHLTREGGHSHRRVLHVADKTGAAVVKSLSEQVLEHPNIQCYTNMTATDLLINHGRCHGARALNNHTGALQSFSAKQTVLATGGASSCYLHTSSTEQAYGDGIAMAWRAGAEIANLEFNQFHPTCLYNPNGQSFLITEAVRGEGGQLRLPNGERFMPRYHAAAELAPRDIVARAIHQEIQQGQINNVLLDISHLPATKIAQLFPTILERCLTLGLDIRQQAIPVVPAAHYTCGGVVTNAQGHTNIPGLYAVGEVACTGLHGANRMASNSLLECLVFARNASDDLNRRLPNSPQPMPHDDKLNSTSTTTPESIIYQIREILSQQVGIVRSNHGLSQALAELEGLRQQYPLNNHPQHFTDINYRNLWTVAWLTTRAALSRRESRGLHYNVDFPKLSTDLYDTHLQQQKLWQQCITQTTGSKSALEN
jgi:L-aspartate oxidase